MGSKKITFNEALSATGLVLYKDNASPPSNAVRMLAAILGLNYDYVEPDFVKLEHRSPEFRKINPMCSIPVLKDGDLIVSDSHAINLYLLNKYGNSKHKESLYPSDLSTRAIVDQCLFFDAGILFRRLLDVSQPSFAGTSVGPTEKNIANIEDAYAVVEAYLGSRPYVACDHVTLADLSIGSSVAALQGIHVLDAKKYPKTRAWLDRLSKESYFKEITLAGAESLANIFQFLWKQNKKE